jgi:dTMP kinase
MAQKLNKGLFLVFEGPEGSGKSSHIKKLYDELTSDGFEVLLTREPGGTLLGKSIRDIILNREDIELDPLTELFLFETDRRQHVATVIKPAVAEGKIVLCDRFNLATFAYQGYGLSLPIDTIKTLDDVALSGIQIDQVFLLDIDVASGLKRAGKVGPADKMEKRDILFHEKVREGYLDITKNWETFKDISHIIDTKRDIGVVYKEIKEKVYEFVSKNTGSR